MLYLSFLFFTTALLYASVGFGGGSTYNALLVLSGVDYRILPSLALICNIIVVAGGCWRFGRAGHIPLRRLTPFVLSSIPAAWIGGRLPVSETIFIGILGFSLVLAGLRLATEQPPSQLVDQELESSPWPLSLLIGGAIGFVSGLSGIGGGIFLTPILYLRRWDSPHRIAGVCSAFILLNSIAGLAGQLAKHGASLPDEILAQYWLLFPAVFIGGQIGSHLGSRRLPPRLLKRLAAVLILYVGLRLLLRWTREVFAG